MPKPMDIQKRMALNIEAHELAREADRLEQAGEHKKALLKRKRALRLLERANPEQKISGP